MNTLREYDVIKKALDNEKLNSDTIEQSVSLIVSIMESWLDMYEYTKDFDMLMYAIKNEYTYSGKVYRGITLLKEEGDFIDQIEFFKVQSFSKDKNVAINFATNNMVTQGDEVNIIREDDEVVHIIIEVVDENIGIIFFLKSVIRWRFYFYNIES